MILSQRKTNINQAGFTAAEPLIALGIIALALYFFVSGFAHFAQQSQVVRTKGDLSDIQTFIRRSLSCNQTIQNEWRNCQSGSTISGYTADGHKLIPNQMDGRAFDKYNLTLKCREGSDSYDISGTIVDTSSTITYNLFDKIPLACDKGVTATPPRGTRVNSVGIGLEDAQDYDYNDTYFCFAGDFYMPHLSAQQHKKSPPEGGLRNL